MPFWNMDLVPRYLPQITAIAKHCESFTIAYTQGEPREEWCRSLGFHKVALKQHGSRTVNWITSRGYVFQQLSDVSCDVVYALSGRWMQWYATHWAEQRGVPQVIRLRGDPEAADGFVTPGRLKGIALDRMYRESFRKAALVIPIADKLKDVAQHYGANNIYKSIPNGVDTEKFHPEQMPLMYHALYVGRVSPEKGSGFLVKLMHNTPEIKYGVAGPIQCDWDPPGNCETLGLVPYEEVQSLYHQANVVLLPSHTEGVPNILLEAYASGRPVIGTPDAIPEEWEVYGLRLPLDVEVWAEALRRVKWFNLADMGAQARRYVERFTWEEYGRRMIEALNYAVKTYQGGFEAGLQEA